jgi:hypothetical protein
MRIFILYLYNSAKLENLHKLKQLLTKLKDIEKNIGFDQPKILIFLNEQN